MWLGEEGNRQEVRPVTCIANNFQDKKSGNFQMFTFWDRNVMLIIFSLTLQFKD